MSWYRRWKPYVPVAVRRARALKKIGKLRKKGLDVQPVEIEGRNIAHTFWGQAWCDHLEKFSDFANRLPRGRTYVRNGSVCHLEIAEGKVKAMVSGSSLYNVSVEIKKLPRKKWGPIKNRCAGQIGSLLELLQGRLSKSVMEVVTDRDEGLFPLPREISLKCDCPDWAVMCKHVAAVLYGVGARLDEKPELLFLLRGVNHEELIGAEADVVTAVTTGKTGRRRRIADSDLKDVFGIEVAEEEAPVADKRRQRRRKATSTKRRASRSGKNRKSGRVTGGKRSAQKSAKTSRRRTRRKEVPALGKAGAKKASRAASSVITGRTVAGLRAKFKMSQSQFAQLLGVSAPTVGNWEKTKGRLNLQARTLNAWNTVAELSKREAWQRLNKS